MREMRISHKVLVGKLEGEKTLGGNTCIWVGNIKISPKETAYDGIGWPTCSQQ